MKQNDEELEFISVADQSYDEDNLNNSYVDPNNTNSSDVNSIIGAHWILNQSKVFAMYNFL